jgi:hypothetical protein
MTMKYFIYGVIGVVVVSVIAGALVVGSPTSERARQFDERRVSDLQSIQWQIVNYWQTKRQLPTELSLLEGSLSSFIVPIDPETNTPYTYNAFASTSFSLCAHFAYPSTDTNGGASGRLETPVIPVKQGGIGMQNWEHQSGYVCFSRTIDPDLYPPFNANAPKATGGCVITGCSGQVCADAEAITTCEWTPQYACYKQYSRCERATDGQCGWAQTPELMQCLAKTGTGVKAIPN